MNTFHSLISKLSTFCCGVGLISLTTIPVNAQQDLSKVQIQTIKVTDEVYMLMGEGGNIGVSVGDDGVFLIDDQFAPLTDKIRTALKTLSNQPIRFLINTHWHFDHTGGNENLGKAGVVIVAHDQVRQRMSVEQFITALNMKFAPSTEVALPVITFNDTVTFHLNNNTIEAFHVAPAHTDGDSVIHFQEANVIHTGDVYFNGIYPFIDVESGGSIKGMIAATNRILGMCNANTKIIPGHGSLSNRAELRAYRNMLETVRDRVQEAIEKEMSLEDFLASKPTADLDIKWGKGFLSPEQFLTIVYNDLSNE